VLELRVMMLDHAAREEYVRSSLTDHAPADARVELARGYATERLLGFAYLEPPKRRRTGPPAPLWLFN
jgi:hypothetical protein